MSEMTDLPEWVWTLLDAVSRYEDEHPMLYRLTDNATDGSLEYSRAECFGAFLSEHNAWPPRQMQELAEFRRHILATSHHPRNDETTKSEGNR